MEAASICWAIIFIVLVLVEMATMGLTTIWFAGGAAAGFICSMLDLNVLIQIVAFFAVSILLLIFTRPFAMRYINQNKVKTNIDSLIGANALVLEEIHNLKETGCVRLEGKEWTARTEDDSVIPKNAEVTVVKIEGVKLIVKKKNEM